MKRKRPARLPSDKPHFRHPLREREPGQVREAAGDALYYDVLY